ASRTRATATAKPESRVSRSSPSGSPSTWTSRAGCSARRSTRTRSTRSDSRAGVKTEGAVGGSTGARPRVSARGDRMPASPIRRLMPLAEEAKRRGVRVLHLNIGQPDLETPAPMRDRLARYPDKVIAYTPSGGTPEYLAYLSEYYR